MMRGGMPGALRQRLGEAAADGLVQFLAARDDAMTEALAAAVVQALEPRFSQIDEHLTRIDGRLDKSDDRFTQLEARLTQKMDAQQLALDVKLSRVMTIQLGSVTLFATVIGGAFIALLVRL